VKAAEVRLNGRQLEHALMITVSADINAARHFLRIIEVKEMEYLIAVFDCC
jgi:hypothetical protein